MRLRLVTIGKPKLAYAQAGWATYLPRLQRLHSVQVTHLADKYADDITKISSATTGSYRVVLDIAGQPLTSQQLASFLSQQALLGREVSFSIGGPHGLPTAIRNSADYHWSLSPLTLPHDLAMVVMVEALYRASAINVGLPYHK